MSYTAHAFEHLPGLQKKVELKKYTTCKVGGPAEWFIEPKDDAAFVAALATARAAAIPITILSGGSNCIVADAGIQGLVVHPKNDQYSIDKTSLTAGAGLSLARLLAICTKNNLTGIEFLAGIPGMLGGSIFGNAGWPSIALGDFISSVDVVTSAGTREQWDHAQCMFAYRTSRMKKEKATIISAVLSLKKGNQEAIRTLVNENILKKNKTQPASADSSGCIFKNPPGLSAGKLIEDAGLKGKRIGGAEVSKKHANFIINTGTASAEDIITLISYIKQQIRDTVGVQLQEEVIYLGFV